MRFFAFLALIGLMMACANVVPPTGGEPDKAPPEYVSSSPANYTILYKGEPIRIDFNEYIKIQSPQQILISPSLEVKPEIKERYRSVYVDLKGQSLSENTTYTINFASSIADITENNKQTNFRYVFSTGDFLDSLKITGQVLLAEKRTGEADVLVGLYPEAQGDSALYKIKPFYFAKTNSDGYFSLENLKYGRFRLFAFKDDNNNLLYQATEAVAFLDSAIATDSLGSNFKLILFNDPESDRKPKEVRSISPGQVRVKYALPLDTATKVVMQNSSAAFTWQINGDSLMLFHLEKEADTLRFLIEKPTSTDTLKVVNRKLGEKGYAKLTLQKLASSTPSIYEPLELITNHPIQTIDTTRFTWKMDTTVVNLPFKLLLNGTRLTVYPEFAPDSRYELFIDSAALIDLFGMPSDTFRLVLNSGNAELFGSLILNELDSLQPGDLIQLFDEQGKLKVQAKWKGESSIRFDKLRAIGYKLRVVRDANNNGRFDTGSYLLRRQPEMLWNAPDLVRLRANWEVELSLAGWVK
jgi:hypothetical protein